MKSKMISCFKNCTSPRVLFEQDIYYILDIIKNPDPAIVHLIKEARELKKSGKKSDYNRLKATLPCVTLNFSFNNWKNNKNIDKPTGFIYIDLDDYTDIELSNPLIFASWLSLSGQGRGILVKVNNLTKNNFKITHEAICKELSVIGDKHACKATQFCILSYDKDIYINEESISWVAKKLYKKEPHSVVYKKEKKDATEMGLKNSIKYDNISDIDFCGEDYIFFPDEKEMIAKAWIPKVIKVGTRNDIISTLAYQFRALNPILPFQTFRDFILSINRSRCEVPLHNSEVMRIIYKIDRMDILIPMLTTPRRIIFNPESTLTKKEKLCISNKLNGQRRSKETQKEIEDYLLNWDKDKLGKVTQVKLAKVANKNIKTIKRYYHLFKELRYKINIGTPYELFI